VATLHAVSHDPTLQHQVTMDDGRKLTAVQLQLEYLDLARKFVEDRYGDDAVERAMHQPPDDTRAYFRGRCLEKYADSVAAASWDSVIFDLPGRESLQRVPTIDPLRGSKAHVAELIDRCDTAEDLFRALTR
jgi:hypothetical protein